MVQACQKSRQKYMDNKNNTRLDSYLKEEISRPRRPWRNKVDRTMEGQELEGGDDGERRGRETAVVS